MKGDERREEEGEVDYRIGNEMGHEKRRGDEKKKEKMNKERRKKDRKKKTGDERRAK